jgi:hypothetical protein
VVLEARLDGGGLDGQEHGAALEAGLDAGRLDGRHVALSDVTGVVVV